jgi:hypothetical protein
MPARMAQWTTGASRSFDGWDDGSVVVVAVLPVFPARRD